MSGAFAYALAFVLAHEGGYVADLGDGAGETHFGITQRSYPHVDIKALTEADAAAIYRRDYWDALGLEQLPPAVAVVAFDAAVNHGPKTSVRLLQQALGVAVDGVIGPVTAQAAEAPEAVDRFCAARAVRYAELAQFPKFGRAWMTRLFRCHAYSAGIPA